jgi:membrane protease YdiL (CAAX protease family)
VPDRQELALLIGAWLSVAACSAALAAGLWFLGRSRRGSLLPPRRRRAVPWSGFELVGVFVLTYLFWPSLVYELLTTVHVLEKPLRGVEEPRLSADRRGLWVTACTFPLQFATIPLVLRLGSGTRPYQLGLTTSRLRQNIVLGCLGLLVFAPLILVLNMLVAFCYSLWTHAPPQEHPLTQLGQNPLSVVEWMLLVFTATVAAAVLEEVVFRGVLQPWFARWPWGGSLAAVVALVAALLITRKQILAAWEAPGLGGVARELGPACFVLLLTLLGLALRSSRARAIWGTALLFSAVHSFAWPTPVALFVLGLGLGWLAERTQSLVAPMVLHGLFNAVACLMLLAGHGAAPEPANGKATTSAGRGPAALSTSTAVPGCWLLRRM